MGQTQLVLSAAANVSKALWPSPRRHKDLKAAFPDRGEELRAYFGVEDDSPLADLSLRDAFEHFDEKIERAALEGQGIDAWFDGMVGDLHNITPDSHKTIMRTFAKDTLGVAYLGKEYQLRELLAALRPIAARWPY